MRSEMRLTGIILITLVTIAGFYRYLYGQVRKLEGRTEVEFYIAGNRRPAPKYQVRRFRRLGDSNELASRFHGLAAQDLEQREYEYVLEPVIAPPGPAGS